MSAGSNNKDVRWVQRLDNFRRALRTLRLAEALSKERRLSELEEQGLIQGFEFTHELGWNVLKDYLEEQGFVGIIGSRNATRLAFSNGLIEEGETWMQMIKARNETLHTYNVETAQRIAADILSRFLPAFLAMEARFTKLASELP